MDNDTAVNQAVPNAVEERDMGSRTALSCQIEALSRDVDWMLAHFTFVADATTLATDCDIICSPAMSVASCQTLFPLPALSFLGDSPELLANYTTFLVNPGVEVTFLVNAEQKTVVEQAFKVLETIPEWQMIFEGTPQVLDPGAAQPLTPKHLPAMQALAQASGLSALERDPLAHGPAFGVWKGHTLAAMGSTRLRIPGAVEIGNIATNPEHRRQGYAANIIAALVRALALDDTLVFLMVYQRNHDAIALYEGLGFQRQRPMYLMRCLVEAPS